MAIGGQVSNPVPGTQPDGMGGVAGLPIPDDMFKETDGNQYAQGGIIAFARGDAVDSGDDTPAPTPPANTAQAPAANQFASTYGIDTSSLLSQNNVGLVNSLFGAPQTKYADAREQQLLKEQADPDKGQNQVQGIALLQLASGLMSSPSFTMGLSKGIAEAVPGYLQGEKDINTRQDQINKGLADIEANRNTEAAQRAQETLSVFGIGTKASEDERTRQSQQAIETQRASSAVQVENLRGGYTLQAAQIEAGARGNKDPLSMTEREIPYGDPNSDQGVQKRAVPIMFDKKSGTPFYYSDEAGSWLSPKYASAIMGRPNIMSALGTWAQQNKAHVGIDSSGNLTYDLNDGKGPQLVHEDWLRSH
jgi:hypothetical protein